MPSHTPRPSPTSVPTAPNRLPTPATCPSTSEFTAGPSPTPVLTARKRSDSSVTCSSIHVSILAIDHISVTILGVKKLSLSYPTSSPIVGSTIKINHTSATIVTVVTQMLLAWRFTCPHTLLSMLKCSPVASVTDPIPRRHI